MSILLGSHPGFFDIAKPIEAQKNPVLFGTGRMNSIGLNALESLDIKYKHDGTTNFDLEILGHIQQPWLKRW